MSYKSLIKKLLGLPGRGAKTFDAFRRLDDRLERPHRAFRIVHVGGTNGKGSVSLKIAEGLKAEGWSVGLYTSPHISSFRERIRVYHDRPHPWNFQRDLLRPSALLDLANPLGLLQSPQRYWNAKSLRQNSKSVPDRGIDGELIPKEAVLRLLPPLFDLAEEPLSFFDFLTALAFLYFRETEVDWAVVEVGLGGRLDATNVVEPDMAVITSIGYDHMEILGDTLEKIASEKGAIAKEGVPFIAGPHAAPFFPHARAVAPVPGFYDLENSSIAAHALRRLGVSEKAIASGIRVRPKCRFEQVGGAILDAAHNPDGFRRLIEALQIHFPGEKFHFIVAFSKDKEWRTCLDLIRPHAVKISFVNSHPRFAPLGGGTVQEALGTADAREVISGSFYLMDEARRAIQRRLGERGRLRRR